MAVVYVTIVPEGHLDDVAIRRLLDATDASFVVTRSLLSRPTRGHAGVSAGRDSQRLNALRYFHAATVEPMVVLADLDEAPCVPALLETWGLNGLSHPNFLFRVAVRSLEAWLLADREGLAEYLSAPASQMPARPDELADPKVALVGLARKYGSPEMRDAIAPRPGRSNRVGRGYLGAMSLFVQNHWRIEEASERSPSLDRAVRRISEFRPTVA